MPPPSWLPVSSRPADVKKLEGQGLSSEMGVAVTSANQESATAMLTDAEKLSTPLAAMMPPELSNVDVTTLFPEFRPGQVRLAKKLSQTYDKCSEVSNTFLFLFSTKV